MSDLIRRSDAIEAIEVVDWYHQNRNKDMVSGANSDEHQAWYKADDVYKALEAVPSADRPQGEWIEFDTKWGRSFYYCTNCMETSEVPTAFGKPLYDFCPNCGARMKGADDDPQV